MSAAEINAKAGIEELRYPGRDLAEVLLVCAEWFADKIGTFRPSRMITQHPGQAPPTDHSDPLADQPAAGVGVAHGSNDVATAFGV